MYDNLTRTNLEFAHREAEKRIEQLEKENVDLKNIIVSCYFQAHSEFTDELEKSIENLFGKDFIEEMCK